MRSWIILGMITCILILGLGAFGFYQTIQSPKADEKEAVESLVLREDDADSFDNFHFYFGLETIYVATVTQTDGEHYYWLYDEDYDRLERVALADLVDKEEVLDQASEDHGEIDVRELRVGYEEETLVYELIFTDEDNSLYYDYYTAEDGEALKRYHLAQSQ